MDTTAWIAAIATMRKLVGVYLALGGKLNAKQAAALATDLTTLDRDLKGLADSLAAPAAAAPAAAAPTVAPTVAAPVKGVSADYFLGGLGTDPYLIGGSPNNPDGLTFTPADAVAWWTDVFNSALNICYVRPTFTPGSHVLSHAGLVAARALAVASTDFAPEDYNPVGLQVIA